jgi:hypothetical protein
MAQKDHHQLKQKPQPSNPIKPTKLCKTNTTHFHHLATCRLTQDLSTKKPRGVETKEQHNAPKKQSEDRQTCASYLVHPHGTEGPFERRPLVTVSLFTFLLAKEMGVLPNVPPQKNHPKKTESREINESTAPEGTKMSQEVAISVL